MRLNNVEMLVSKVEVRKNKKEEAYLLIGMLDLLTGDSFQIATKDIDLMQKLKPMSKYSFDFNLTNSRYGFKLSIDHVNKNLGAL